LCDVGRVAVKHSFKLLSFFTFLLISYVKVLWLLPGYGVNAELPASVVVVNELDKKGRCDHVDGTNGVTNNVKKNGAHCQTFVQIYTSSSRALSSRKIYD